MTFPSVNDETIFNLLKHNYATFQMEITFCCFALIPHPHSLFIVPSYFHCFHQLSGCVCFGPSRIAPTSFLSCIKRLLKEHTSSCIVAKFPFMCPGCKCSSLSYLINNHLKDNFKSPGSLQLNLDFYSPVSIPFYPLLKCKH